MAGDYCEERTVREPDLFLHERRQNWIDFDKIVQVEYSTERGENCEIF